MFSYDDFPLIEPVSTCRVASFAFEGLLRNLGWLYTADPTKVIPFAPSFDVLGIRLDVGNLGTTGFSMANKPSRVEKISGLLAEVRDSGKITVRQAQVIHGKLNFAMGFYMGQSLKIAARAFAFLSSEKRCFNKRALQDLCMWTNDLLTTLKPKDIHPGGTDKPVVIFTDAAYDDDVATWGVVLLDSETGLRTAAGGLIPDKLVRAWRGFGVEQVITLAEAYAVLLARIMFRETLVRRKVLYFVDNEGARYSLIKACSPSLPLLQIVQLFHSCSEHDLSMPWIERVPSQSNIADLPSRNQLAEALRIIGGRPWNDLSAVDFAADLCCDFSGIPSILKHVGDSKDISLLETLRDSAKGK